MKKILFSVLILVSLINGIKAQEKIIAHFIVAEDTLQKIAYISKPVFVYFYDDYDFETDPAFPENIKSQGLSNLFYTFYIDTDYDEYTMPVKFVSYYTNADMKATKRETNATLKAYKNKGNKIKRFYFRYD